MTAENMLPEMPAIDTIATTTSPEITQGYAQSMWNSFSFDSLLQKMDLTRENLLEIALYFGGGILCGFLIRKYHHALMITGVVLLGVCIAHYFNIITVMINGDTIKSLLGCPTVPCDITLFSFITQWVSAHVRATVSFISGFVIGLWVA